eukprot:scaffold1258_cov91-Skeletonema_menzelii.AAC.1
MAIEADMVCLILIRGGNVVRIIMPRVVGLRNLEIVEPTGSPLSKLVVMDSGQSRRRGMHARVVESGTPIKGSHLHT